MAGGHTVYEQQAILSTTVVMTHTFCMENENILTPRGLGACQRDPIMQVGHGEANFIIILLSTALYSALFLFIVSMRSSFWWRRGEPHLQFRRTTNKNFVGVFCTVFTIA